MSDLAAALCLVLILEGLLPFASPRSWREAVSQLANFSDQTLRTIGGVCMLLGLTLLILVK
ncbi:MAG: DUF2065 domain-containing protein [Pseudomonadota bacterium]